MKKTIGLCVAGLVLAAVCQAHTMPPAMTLMKMDEAKQKEWLARWDKNVSGEVKTIAFAKAPSARTSRGR